MSSVWLWLAFEARPLGAVDIYVLPVTASATPPPSTIAITASTKPFPGRNPAPPLPTTRPRDRRPPATAMPISSTHAGRLGTGPARAPAPARWSPYARSSVPEPQGGRGGAKASRPPLRLDPATERLLGPAQKAAPSGSRRRAEPAAPDGASAAPAGRSRGGEMTSPEPVLKPKPKPDAGIDAPPVKKPRCSGGGGFVFLCALAGHTAAISGISVPRCSDKLYSGSVDGSIRVWDRNSGKCIDVIKLGGKVGCMITHGPWVFIGIPKSVEAWNTQTGMKLSLQGPSGLVCSMTITDGMLFAGTGDGRIMAWKFPSKESNMEPVSILTGHQRPVISLSISATRLYSGSLDKTIKVWDLMTLQCVQTLSEHKAPVTSVLCWDEKLLSCSLDKTVKLWTLSESGDLQVKYTNAEEHGLRTLFGMHRVGKTPVLFCSLHNSNCIRQLDLPSFEEVGTLSSKKEVRTIELADGGPLFTGDCSGELKVWRWALQQDQDQEAASAAHS
ncbi:hypothetical protein GQ55_5G508700 [Panicum hallii var. hallii]|uniref:Uncharacterized protein n=1 Tax=Panicum hallii var. hallii TaxID=1504633 RepID=A0A2T7DS70_9POAL|nr:hypothetical protein GQ55_5G508700 [Panicum hallii var. hallii]